MIYYTPETIYQGFEIIKNSIPTQSRFVLCTDTEAEIMEWLEEEPGREYKNILHNFTCKSSKKYSYEY
jgi:hypothetical protein